MWAKYMKDDYVIVAPKDYAGVIGFNEKPEMMEQFGFVPVKDADGFDAALPVRYKEMDGYIERYNLKEEKPVEPSQKDKILALRDDYLKVFAGTRKDTDVTNKSSAGVYVSLEDETKALEDYRTYLKNIENEPDFPNIKLLGFGDWLKERTKQES